MYTDIAELTTSPIDVGNASRRAVPPECGATVTLDGYARRFTTRPDGTLSETLYLEYDAYEAMALKEMRSLIASARERFAVAHVCIIHRLGRIEIGETSVVISVASPHRAAAFEACEWLIRELKRTVPIWKKEVYGEGESWIAGDTPV